MAIETFTAATTPPAGDPYDLYATDTQSRGAIPFAVTWPTAPTTGPTVSATTIGELQSAVNSGARIINYSGTSSSALTIGSPGAGQVDAHVVINFADGASIGALTIYDNTHYVHLSSDSPRGGSVNGDIIIGSYSTNILFEDMDINAGGVGIYDTRIIAFVGCDISTSNNYFAFWPGGGVATHSNQDVIFANTRSVAGAGAASSFRLQHINRLVIVDSMGDTRLSGYATLRLEFNTMNVWVRNSTFMGGGFTFDPQVGSPRPTATVNDIYVYDTNGYRDGLITINDTNGDISDPTKVFNVTIDDLLFHSDNYTPGAEIQQVQGSWTVGIADYADFTSYPSWGFQ